MYYLAEAYRQIQGFMIAGGDVLYVIGLATFLLWLLFFERVWYFRTGALRHDVDAAIQRWEKRAERNSWFAHQERALLVSETRQKIFANTDLLKALVAICPLLGLLGTVTGMIDVFHILAVTGGGDPRSMAGGVSKATIPTMAGMVAAISGVFANLYVSRTAQREVTLLEDHMTMDH